LTEVSISFALAGLALAADDLAHPFELLGHALVGGHDLVERVGDLAEDPELIAGHPHREIADPHGLQRLQQLIHLGRGAAVEAFAGRRRRRPAIGLRMAACVLLDLILAGRFSGRLHGSAPIENTSGEMDRVRATCWSISGLIWSTQRSPGGSLARSWRHDWPCSDQEMAPDRPNSVAGMSAYLALPRTAPIRPMGARPSNAVEAAKFLLLQAFLRFFYWLNSALRRPTENRRDHNLTD
jgi:hypothetical protein